jgi:hypothetical protein
MTNTQMTRAQRRALEKVAQSLVEVCVRNALEGLHAGIFPSSRIGDYSDVKVVTPYGEIPWTRLARISDEELKPLMIGIVNKTFTFLSFLDELAAESANTRRWKRPKLDRDLMISVRRRRAGHRSDLTRDRNRSGPWREADDRVFGRAQRARRARARMARVNPTLSASR